MRQRFWVGGSRSEAQAQAEGANTTSSSRRSHIPTSINAKIAHKRSSTTRVLSSRQFCLTSDIAFAPFILKFKFDTHQPFSLRFAFDEIKIKNQNRTHKNGSLTFDHDHGFPPATIPAVKSLRRVRQLYGICSAAPISTAAATAGASTGVPEPMVTETDAASDGGCAASATTIDSEL